MFETSDQINGVDQSLGFFLHRWNRYFSEHQPIGNPSDYELGWRREQQQLQPVQWTRREFRKRQKGEQLERFELLFPWRINLHPKHKLWLVWYHEWCSLWSSFSTISCREYPFHRHNLQNLYDDEGSQTHTPYVSHVRIRGFGPGRKTLQRTNQWEAVLLLSSQKILLIWKVVACVRNLRVQDLLFLYAWNGQFFQSYIPGRNTCGRESEGFWHRWHVMAIFGFSESWRRVRGQQNAQNLLGLQEIYCYALLKRYSRLVGLVKKEKFSMV